MRALAFQITQQIAEHFSDNDQYFPPIDYTKHPYYKDLMANASEEDKAKALEIYKPMLERFEHTARMHRNYIKTHDKPKFPLVLKPQIKTIKKNGIIGFRMTPEQRAEMKSLTQAAVGEIDQRRANMKPEDRGVEGVSSILGHIKEPNNVYKFFNKLLEDYNVFSIAHAYKNLPYLLKFVNLQVNDHEDTCITQDATFNDGYRSKAFYMHVDSTLDHLKVIIYRSERNDADTGAFRYVPGSDTKYSIQDKAIRKANDKSGFDTVHDIEKRKMFAALPPEYQKKANFGNDLVDMHPAVPFLLGKEKIYGTDVGDMVLFNSDGIHRGNIFNKPGRREIFQLLLVPNLA